jgi:hypothetical protein
MVNRFRIAEQLRSLLRERGADPELSARLEPADESAVGTPTSAWIKASSSRPTRGRHPDRTRQPRSAR